jgi:hypothetical protein
MTRFVRLPLLPLLLFVLSVVGCAGLPALSPSPGQSAARKSASPAAAAVAAICRAASQCSAAHGLFRVSIRTRMCHVLDCLMLGDTDLARALQDTRVRCLRPACLSLRGAGEAGGFDESTAAGDGLQDDVGGGAAVRACQDERDEAVQVLALSPCLFGRWQMGTGTQSVWRRDART